MLDCRELPISIPFSTIKSCIYQMYSAPKTSFQFHLVRLKGLSDNGFVSPISDFNSI